MDLLLYIVSGIIAVVLVLAAAIAYRYRQQIQTGWLMYKTYRQFKQKTKPSEKTVETIATPSNSPLARCPKCGKWTPEDEAVKIKNNFYCSHQCMEASFKVVR